jgi:hypothetical protein
LEYSFSDIIDLTDTYTVQAKILSQRQAANLSFVRLECVDMCSICCEEFNEKKTTLKMATHSLFLLK